MGRILPPDIDAVRTSKNFRYYDWAIITLPLNSGDAAPIVFRVSTAAISMQATENFVVFTYVAFQGALGRTPTPTEQSDWTTALETAAFSQSALLLVAQDRISDLFSSSEYAARNRTDYEFVTDLYSAFLERSPEPGGREVWMEAIGTYGRPAVIAGFAGSTEFATRVQRYNSAQEVASDLDSEQNFEPDIESYSPVSLSEGRAIDNVDLSLFNAGNTYSQIVAKGDRLLYPSRAVVGRAFKTADGSYKADPILIGSAKFTQVEGRAASVTIISDMSRRGTSVVEPLTQRCLNVYKAPGCDSTDPSPTCSRIFDDAVNGCAAKDPAPMLIGATNNQPSFRGAPQPSGSTQVELDSEVSTGGGFGEGGMIDPRDAAVRFGAVGSKSLSTVEI